MSNTPTVVELKAHVQSMLQRLAETDGIIEGTTDVFFLHVLKADRIRLLGHIRDVEQEIEDIHLESIPDAPPWSPDGEVPF